MMSTTELKKQLYVQLARIGKAAGNGHRLELLEYLAQRDRTVDELSQLSGLSFANTSRHLQLLRESGLVQGRRDGQHVRYSIAHPAVMEMMSIMRRLGDAQIAEIDRLVHSYLTVKDQLEPIPRAELLTRVRGGLVTVLDVRPPEEFAAGHLPGAVNIPLKALEQHLGELPRHQEIVAYCRGPYCVLAFDAVAQLRARGFRARRLEDGFPEWKQAGLPVVESPRSFAEG